jgi:hypothetical protein
MTKIRDLYGTASQAAEKCAILAAYFSQCCFLVVLGAAISLWRLLFVSARDTSA